MKKVLYITILACSTLWGSCTEKINNPPEQIPL